ncbi:Hypothetical protein Cul210932_1921 [Corynebacterium ulcerans]|nr:Hypothetical protein Cul210932_1921 [Corynebacterium ulcerans]ALD95629.1 Hypothetical protein Cul131001_1953 [Corynebacterium ulcerans]
MEWGWTWWGWLTGHKHVFSLGGGEVSWKLSDNTSSLPKVVLRLEILP